MAADDGDLSTWTSVVFFCFAAGDSFPCIVDCPFHFKSFMSEGRICTACARVFTLLDKLAK